jgi:uncharacterized protein involved in copper resistance
MRLMRLFMVCLLSLGVAVQGYAGMRLMQASCPMLDPVAATTAHESHAPVDHALMHHAGTEHAESGSPGIDHGGPQHGKHCQHDVGCQSAGQAIASTLVTLVSAASVMPVLAAPAPYFRSHIPPLLARPPALA